MNSGKNIVARGRSQSKLDINFSIKKPAHKTKHVFKDCRNCGEPFRSDPEAGFILCKACGKLKNPKGGN